MLSGPARRGRAEPPAGSLRTKDDASPGRTGALAKRGNTLNDDLSFLGR
ncbi:hypothetical protein LptCag_2551 [Leptospirillum ferriphilum]|uniref:Uncharacterized protein n=1 Tax=Leptospirillum ferriphilum TaxID=178606 RepID=A0A094WHG6_9BACT|nr:hypothetical protein LptCag_2551 [Leptospirillum ferriphilum]